MELQTQRLKIVLLTREEVEKMIEGMSDYEKSQISADWLDRLRGAEEGDPWTFAFRVIHRETGNVVGPCSFKGRRKTVSLKSLTGSAPNLRDRGTPPRRPGD